jgi:hypothetical protein
MTASDRLIFSILLISSMFLPSLLIGELGRLYRHSNPSSTQSRPVSLASAVSAGDLDLDIHGIFTLWAPSATRSFLRLWLPLKVVDRAIQRLRLALVFRSFGETPAHVPEIRVECVIHPSVLLSAVVLCVLGI